MSTSAQIKVDAVEALGAAQSLSPVLRVAAVDVPALRLVLQREA